MTQATNRQTAAARTTISRDPDSGRRYPSRHSSVLRPTNCRHLPPHHSLPLEPKPRASLCAAISRAAAKADRSRPYTVQAATSPEVHLTTEVNTARFAISLTSGTAAPLRSQRLSPSAAHAPRAALPCRQAPPITLKQQLPESPSAHTAVGLPNRHHKAPAKPKLQNSRAAATATAAAAHSYLYLYL